MKCKNCNQSIGEDVKVCPICESEQVTNTVPSEETVDETVQTAESQEHCSTPTLETSQQVESNSSYAYTNYNTDANTSYQQAPEKPINTTTYLVLSILTTICCCLPLGIVSIVFASKISASQSVGRYEEAQEFARKAKLFMIIGFVLGLIVNILYLLFVITSGVAGLSYY